MVSHGRLLESHSFYHVHVIALRSRDTFTAENDAFNFAIIARLDFYENYEEEYFEGIND